MTGAEPLTLVLVRHGVTDWNEAGRLMGRADVGLNARGHEQAAALAAALAELPLRAVLASPQRRAQETAAPIAAAHGVAVETESDLAEVWIGPWQGKTFAELRDDPDVLRYIADGTYRCDAVESAASVQARMVAVLERLRERGGTVGLVSHGDPLRLLLTHCLGLALGAYRALHVATGSASVVHVGRHGSQLLSLNWQPGGLGSLLAQRH